MTEQLKKILKSGAEAFSITLSEQMLERFSVYSDFLLDYNQKVNLTAITEPHEVVIKHFLDSLLLSDAVSFKTGDSLVDVGSGAGFPGVPVKILREDVSLTLLDSLNKRVFFLCELSSRLSLPFSALHFRAEQAGQDEKFREQFDVATARAVASLPLLCEYCLPFVMIGGVFAALKAQGAEEELAGAARAIEALGGSAQEIKRYTLPDSSERAIIIIKKISHTPTNYPRPSAKIAKAPL